MEITEYEKKKYVGRLLLSRMRLLAGNGFFGLLLMHMKFSLDDNCETASTDGERIYFSPDFMEELSDKELDFVLMHEVMHCALRHCLRTGDRDGFVFNVACDIVVNSNIKRSCDMDDGAITIAKYGVSMHTAPDGKEGFEYTAEEVYEMLTDKAKKKNGRSGKGGSKKKGALSAKDLDSEGGWDDHSRWGTLGEDGELRDIWAKRLSDACASISVRDPSNTCGSIPLCALRLLGKLTKPQTDWRTVLECFIQSDPCDYTLCPPDRRFSESPFFLPDYGDREDAVDDVLFMVDTSGSVSDDMLAAAYSEISGAIEQFEGRLRGRLGFFDSVVPKAPEPFESVADIKKIKPVGGGGTSFHAVFDYIERHMTEKPPASIVILTDGYASFPAEHAAGGVPVCWLLTNDVINPPWGKVARIKL